MLNRIIKYFLENRIITAFVLIAVLIGGLATAPFNWHYGLLPRDPIAVDAIPDIGDNQQIVATEWMGRSPKDIQEQITYPLSTSLLGIPGVKTIRSTSMFGMSFIYIIFNDDVEFYWSRSRILEKLNSLPADLLPDGVQPTLGPDATALGQIFWYTLEGRNPKTGKPTGGWDPQELRTIQDYYVRYGLSAADGVSEVASVGGYVKEYQVDIDPDAMRSHGVNIMQVMLAVKNSNIDVGAGTMEVNKAEYLIRGLGYIKSLEDLENAAITSRNGVPVRVKDIAKVNFGPGDRRGGLDKEGQEAVGGVVVARYGSNPMDVINNVKAKIAEMESGMPEKTLKDGTVSKVTVVPFYDRTQLIRETIGTLEEALTHEVLICIIVVLILVLNLRASVVIAGMLPLAVISTFIVMKMVGVEANIVALSGIAIAIGVMVDVGVVMMENVVKRLEVRGKRLEVRGKELETVIFEGVSEVSSAILTAMATTVVSFIPVFAMQAQEGKMFHPLAFTKTFALMSALLLGFLMLPTLAYWVFSIAGKARITGLSKVNGKTVNRVMMAVIVVLAVYLLADLWLPLGPENGMLLNVVFVASIIGVILGLLWLLVIFYERILRWCLSHRLLFMSVPLALLVCGVLIWRNSGQEFMPTLDEGSFMLMPTSMPHSGVEENIRYCKILDRRIKTIPEIESVVGKWGRVNSALDPAPIQMYETVINYKPEYELDENGHRKRFKDGYHRLWRPEIRTEDDIWNAITEVTRLPGVTGSPKLQPIATRQVMLSTGLKAPMGLKIYGPDLESIEQAGLQFEKVMRQIPEVNSASVYYDRASGAPYVEIRLDRDKLSRYGIQVGDVQSILSTAIGANIYYMWGTLQRMRSLTFTEQGLNSTIQDEILNVSNVRLRAGAQFFHTWGDHTVNLGAIFESKMKLNADLILIETQTEDSIPMMDGQCELPLVWGVGASYTWANRLTVGVDFERQYMSSAKYFGAPGSESGLQDRSRLALGAEYRHNPNSRHYAERMFWRAGCSIQDEYLASIGAKRYTASIGVGFPLYTIGTVINTTLEYSHRGSAAGLEDNSLRLTIGVSVAENWFFKRKL